MIRNFANVEVAENLNVPHQIHEGDHLYQFLVDHPDIGDRALEEYFLSARESAERIAEIIKRNVQPHGLANTNIEKFSLFDFASGFGMVNRHFRNVVPGADVMACDIHPEAVAFHRNYLGIDCQLSSEMPSDLIINSQYDVVLALSFFSHMPNHTWSDWLSVLLDVVKEGGLMIFTTHGPSSGIAKVNCLVDKGLNFKFYSASEQLDLDTSSYGTSYSHPRHVMSVLSDMKFVHLSEYKMGAWWGGNQDVYVLCKGSNHDPKIF